MIRPATPDDIPTLLRIENRCFDTDRLSRHSFRHLLTKGHAATLVYTENEQILGYVMVLFNRGTSLARMYSIAVAPEARSKGIAAQLITAAEKTALKNDCACMRLEVRSDNTASLNLFQHAGYRRFGTYDDYYEDHTDAVRFEKQLTAAEPSTLTKVPYFPQTLEFTCGPSCLMMAMNALNPAITLDRTLELRLWREATTIFMTSGHGGCGPFGLALAAHHRNFKVEIYVNERETLFVDSVRSGDKKAVIRLVNADFLNEIHEQRIPLHYARLSTQEIRTKLAEGGIPIILISSYRIYHEKTPHWLVVTGMDDKFIYAHDPFIDSKSGKTLTDSVNLPIALREFERMSRYGRSGQRAAVIVYNKPRAAKNKSRKTGDGMDASLSGGTGK